MSLHYGNPYSEIHEIYRHQGSLDHVTDSVVLTSTLSVKNAEEMQFYITTLNQRFGIEMQYVTSSGIRLRDAAGAVLPAVPIIAAATVSPFVSGRQAYTLNHVLPSHADFVRFQITYRADTAYVPPMPAWTGVAHLYNSALSIKDENAPLLEINVKLVNPKP